jgi:hypothetical protein
MPLPTQRLPARHHATRRLAAAAAALCALLVVGACDDDPFAQTAARGVASDTLIITALTGTSPNAFSAVLLRATPTAASPERTADGDYHVVLDINAQGQPVVHPAQLVSSVAARRISIRRIDGIYDSLGTAPTESYSADSSLVVAPGAIVGVRVPGGGGECQFTGRPYFYSKLVVDSVRLAERLLFVRATTNPNCGFRSFAPGIPRE